MVSVRRSGPARHEFAYIYHGKQDEASRSGLLRAIRGIDQPVDAGAAKDEPSREEANEGNMISLCGIGCHDDEDTNDEAEHICNGEPREIRKAEGSMLGCCDGRSHKGDKPCELSQISQSARKSLSTKARCPEGLRTLHYLVEGSREEDPTYHRDRDGGQRKGVADDVVHAHRAHARGSAALRVHLPIHFAERRRV